MLNFFSFVYVSCRLRSGTSFVLVLRKFMALEELEKKLYQRNSQADKNKVIPEKEGQAKKNLTSFSKKEWTEEGLKTQTNERSTTIVSMFSHYGKILFWILLAVFLVVSGIAGFYLYKFFTVKDINLSVGAPQEVLIGVPFDLTVNFSNNSNNILQNAILSISLPIDSTLTGDNFDRRVISKNLGDLDIGVGIREEFSIIIVGEERTIKQFDVSMSYALEATLKTRFEEAKSVEVIVRESGIKLDLITPQRVFNNEKFDIEIHFQNVSNIDFSGLELELTYPPNFIFKKASIQPIIGNRIWNLGKLKENSKGNLIISGSIIGPELSFFEIKSSLDVAFLGQKYLINEKSASLNIAPSPLSLVISVNNYVDYLASPGGSLRYVINYSNDTDIGLKDVVINAQLIGEMFDFLTLETQAFFNSLDKTLVWNVANTPELRFLKPGASGFLEFTIKLKPDYPIKRLSDRNFILKVQAEINSPTVPHQVVADRTVSVASIETKVIGKIAIDAYASFEEGNWPPKANESTNLTVHWIITNFSNDVYDIEVRSFLQSGITWVGKVESNIENQPFHNERTGEIIWKIERIPATKGIIDEPIKATFQIKAVPSIIQVGSYMPLINKTSIVVVDGFVNLELRNFDKFLSTQLIDDLKIGSARGEVVP